MKTLGYYNGKYGELEEMSVPMLDRACYFGDGVYDATYSRNHIIYNLNEHIDRFYNSAALMGIRIAQTKDEMKALLSEMVRKVDDGEQFVYCEYLDYADPCKNYRQQHSDSSDYSRGYPVFPLQCKNIESDSQCAGCKENGRCAV